MKHLKITFGVCLLMLCACNGINPIHDPITYGDGYMPVQLNTNKATYKPGETVRLTLNKMVYGESNIIVRYKHLNTVLLETPLTNLAWDWQPPSTDFKGYLVELYNIKNGEEVVYGTIAVDVSSNISRFPRNGFLSVYGLKTTAEIEQVMENLNRYHINYVQYQDWHYKHHKPLAGTPANPMEVWTDIISRTCYKSTVEGYIAASHARGMKSLFYNLAYGALSDAADDNVQEEWYLFTDTQRQNKDHHQLGSPFKSSIYLLHPGNDHWCDYIRRQTDDVYAVFDFDGYQIDQLGDRGRVYDYNGAGVDIASHFKSFIEKLKVAQPNKSLVMNAVSQYGQEGQIAEAPVDFLYTEIWEHSNTNGYGILSDVITNNDKWSDGKKTVLAAYLNYNHGKQGRGYFNTPGVLLASSVASVWGGTILQMGEHMLCNEYFPNNNLTMTGELKKAMVSYYDFLTAYQNLLRDGGTFVDIEAVCTNNKVQLNTWPPVKNQVSVVGKRFDTYDVLHLLNFTNATHLDWCDTNADQGEPSLIENLTVAIPSKGTVKSVWFASPDHKAGAATSLGFTQHDTGIAVTLPSLKYWDMVVVEYE